MESQFFIKKSRLCGDITLPSSKSQTLRAILFGALGNKKSCIRNYLPSADTNAMIEACRLFGASIEVLPDEIQIKGVGGNIQHCQDVIHAGNSGIVLRFCSGVGALTKHPVVITGDYSIRTQRPMKAMLEALEQLGVSCLSMRGDHYAPLIIQGPLQSGKAILDGGDSQPVSALLIASAFSEGPVELFVNNAGERPWVALTLNWFDRLGISYENQSFEYYKVPGGTKYEGFDYHVPGDLSSAAFPFAAALITNSEIVINNIDKSDFQGDKKLFDVFQKMGAQIEYDESNKTAHVKKGKGLVGISVDINNFIDALPILAVVACYAEGETHIRNGAIARQKECDRIRCIAVELRKMGANITETEDGLFIKKSSLKGALVDSHQDHRMAMSLAVAALGADEETCISNVDCIGKTFPNFLEKFNALGANMRKLSRKIE